MPPYAFTEHGVLMLSSVLNSERSIKVNIQIMRIYTRIRGMLLTNADILRKVDKLEKAFLGHDEKIALIFEYIKQFEEAKQEEQDFKTRTRIGFRPEKE